MLFVIEFFGCRESVFSREQVPICNSNGEVFDRGCICHGTGENAVALSSFVLNDSDGKSTVD